ncbi:MAG TPA: DUF2961 domain-containing protein [Firmicutes bacterium]|nr:DUF2961 domain-containing protein [Bacillota bacterium]
MPNQRGNRAARGVARLTGLSALPVLDDSARIGYEGSISKQGDNADWDWGLYTDERGEWVLMEVDGPGCLFNFTQHRYPTSETPVFRFYFDHADEPQFSITPEEFGAKAPFLRPLADQYIGPEENGRGPIRVVRSFVPMEFTTHCKITSSVKLEGAEKAKGQGGWGHVTYQLYPDAEGLHTFDPAENCKMPSARPVGSPAVQGGFRLRGGEARMLLSQDAGGAVVGIRAETAGFSPELLRDLWIRISFDGYPSPFVEAPFGTFFGCEYGRTPAAIRTALLTCDFSGGSGEGAVFENRFPMPYFRSVRIELENRGEGAVDFANAAVYTNGSLRCAPSVCGYFTASPYYPPTPNQPGENSVIADLAGSGHMVYGVLSGHGITDGCGCEGDVRVFIDDGSSPVVESDGSESWASYGWGFVTPPQCNPFSAYNGAPGVNSDWSELRLTFTDSYPFRRRLRFELEHGEQNNGGGCHSGQVFAYMRPEHRPAMDLCGEFGPGGPGYRTDGRVEEIRDRFENGVHTHYETFRCVQGMTASVLSVPFPPDSRGLLLQRVSRQDQGPMEASLSVDGEEIPQHWLYADGNPYYRLLEDAFLIPERFVRGKRRAEIRIRPLTAGWNECRYRVYALAGGMDSCGQKETEEYR